MTRHHMTPEGSVLFTAEEEAARDAEEAAWDLEQASPSAPTAPTKEQLMAELAALTAKIQALE